MVSFDNPVVQSDLFDITHSSFDWSFLGKKKILVTGATGMLASYIVFILLYLNEKIGIPVKIIALCRDPKKAYFLYSPFIDKDYFSLLVQDVCEPFDEQVDYIFHFAGNASPYYITTDPVGILKSNILGTFNVLDMASKFNINKIIFASTREVYGKNAYDCVLRETSFGVLDPLEDRSCYPESKRAAESLLRAYYLQYNISFNSVRIAHSYGPGISIHNDGRVMSDFISDVVNGKDIVLNSDGSALRSFCYITDAIMGIFMVLKYGVNGEAYNLSNEKEEISVKELADLVASFSSSKATKVVFNKQVVPTVGYCSYKRVALDTSKIEQIGWSPNVSLQEGIKRTITSFTFEYGRT